MVSDIVSIYHDVKNTWDASLKSLEILSQSQQESKLSLCRKLEDQGKHKDFRDIES